MRIVTTSGWNTNDWQVLPTTFMVAQDRVEVAHYVRAADTQWTSYDLPGICKTYLNLASLNTSLPLADIYRKIVFPAAEASGCSNRVTFPLTVVKRAE